MTGVKLYYCGEGTGAMYETDCREDLGYGLYVSYADYAALQAALLAKSAAYEALVAVEQYRHKGSVKWTDGVLAASVNLRHYETRTLYEKPKC